LRAQTSVGSRHRHDFLRSARDRCGCGDRRWFGIRGFGADDDRGADKSRSIHIPRRRE